VNRETRLLAGIVVLAFAARVGVNTLTRGWVFPRKWDFGQEMGAIAASVASGTGYGFVGNPPEPTAWMAPIYPYLIAAAFEVFGIYSKGSALALELFQTIVSAATGILLYALGKRLFSPQAGLWAALVHAIYPAAIHFAAQKVYSTSLFVFCVLLVILIFMRLGDRPDTKRALALGAAIGFTALVEPVILGAVPFGLAWLYSKTRSARVLVRTATLALVAGALISAPWIVRNYVVFGQFVFIKSVFGYALYLGNNPYVARAGTEWEEAMKPLYGRFVGDLPARLLSPSELAYVQRTNEAERNSLYLRKALAFIAYHPVEFAQLSAIRALWYWGKTWSTGRALWQALLVALAYFAVLGLALLSLRWSAARALDARLLWLFVITLPLPYYFTIEIHGRYRFPVEAIMMVFAGYALHRLHAGWRPRTEPAVYRREQGAQSHPGP
jgi:4-amino-4-deoxy-L-arabinose transferase-like glycosyltransferase